MDGQMNIFDFLEKPKREPDVSNCVGCIYFDKGNYRINERSGDTWKYNCIGTRSANWPGGTPKNVSIKSYVQSCYAKKIHKEQWLPIDKHEPPQGEKLEFMYLWTFERKNDRRGICEGYWKGDHVLWLGMPSDIGKKEVIAWRRICTEQ